MKRNAPTTSLPFNGAMAPVPHAACRVVLTLKFDAIAAAPVGPTGDGDGPGVGMGVGVGVGVGVDGLDGTVTRSEDSGWTSVLQPGSEISRSDDASAAR